MKNVDLSLQLFQFTLKSELRFLNGSIDLTNLICGIHRCFLFGFFRLRFRLRILNGLFRLRFHDLFIRFSGFFFRSLNGILRFFPDRFNKRAFRLFRLGLKLYGFCLFSSLFFDFHDRHNRGFRLSLCFRSDFFCRFLICQFRRFFDFNLNLALLIQILFKNRFRDLDLFLNIRKIGVHADPAVQVFALCKESFIPLPASEFIF